MSFLNDFVLLTTTTVAPKNVLTLVSLGFFILVLLYVWFFFMQSKKNSFQLIQEYRDITALISENISEIFLTGFLIFVYPFIVLNLLISLSEFNSFSVLFLIYFLAITEKVVSLLKIFKNEKQKSNGEEKTSLFFLVFSSFCLILLMTNQTPFDGLFFGSFIAHCMESGGGGGGGGGGFGFGGGSSGFNWCRDLTPEETQSMNNLFGNVGLMVGAVVANGLVMATAKGGRAIVQFVQLSTTKTATVLVPVATASISTATSPVTGAGLAASLAAALARARAQSIANASAKKVADAQAARLIVEAAADSTLGAAVSTIVGEVVRQGPVNNAALAGAGLALGVAMGDISTKDVAIHVAKKTTVAVKASAQALDETFQEFLNHHVEMTSAPVRNELWQTLLEASSRELETYVDQGITYNGYRMPVTVYDGKAKTLFVCYDHVHVFIIEDSELKQGFAPVTALKYKFEGEESYCQVIVNGQFMSFDNVLDACLAISTLFPNDQSKFMMLIGLLDNDAAYRRQGATFVLRIDNASAIIGQPQVVIDALPTSLEHIYQTSTASIKVVPKEMNFFQKKFFALSPEEQASIVRRYKQLHEQTYASASGEKPLGLAAEKIDPSLMAPEVVEKSAQAFLSLLEFTK